MTKNSRSPKLEGVSVHKKDEGRGERAKTGEKRLLFSRYGTRLAEATLQAGETIILTPPSEGQTEVTEIYYLLQGVLRCDLPAGPLRVGPDDYLIAEDLEERVVFIAETDARLLYIRSHPFLQPVPAELQARLQLAMR